jgi:hypothetical protein
MTDLAVRRELQAAACDDPFYLGCRTAATLLDVRNEEGEVLQVRVWRWPLIHDGVLEVVEKGDHTKRRASRYRYLAD